MLSWDLVEEPSVRRCDLPPAAPPPAELEVDGGKFRIDWSSWSDGKSMGMKCLTIDTGALTTVLLPCRGMGIWKCAMGRTEFGWQSPVRGPVHPSLVPIADASGIGWLEGFDELLVRCGLLSNGAPEFDANGRVRYGVHGRIANLPVHALRIEVQPELGILEVIGRVQESRFLVYTLELETRMRFFVGRSAIEITDTVLNPLTSPGSMQLLYHINLGQPVLQSGSRVLAPLERLAPRDERAAVGIDAWDVCQGPEEGFREQVYYATPLSDDNHWTETMLTNSDNSLGFSVQFDVRTLPCLNVWKNTAGVEDGYVLGLEPATGFPNPRSFEEQQGRLVRLQGGQTRSFRLRLLPLGNAFEVNRAIERIQKLQTRPCCIETQPQAGWSQIGP